MTNRAEQWTIAFCVFVAGATLMALEVAGFRIIGRHFGTAVRETTTVIAVFLTAMSAGYWAGGRFGDRSPRLESLLLVLSGAGATTLIIPFIEGPLSAWIATTSRLSIHAFVTTVVLFSVPTFLLASTTPIAVRLLSRGVERTGSVAGAMSALSTVGSIAGSVAAAFFLLDWLKSINRTVLFLAICTLATAALVAGARYFPAMADSIGLTRFAPAQRRRAYVVLMAIAAGVGLIIFARLISAPIDLRPFTEKNPRNRVLFEQDSRYHQVQVREHDGKWRFLVFGLHTQTSMAVADPIGPGLEYTNYFHIGKMLRPNARRILFIGLGGGTGPKQFLAFYPDVIIDAVDVDPVVVDVAQRFFHVTAGPRLRLHAIDGRVFLSRSQELYDLVIIDTYTVNRYGVTIPPHLVTREFFELISKRLSPDGLVHFHCAAPVLNRMSRAMYRTISEVFPHIGVFGSTELIAGPTAFPLVRSKLVASAEEMVRSGKWKLPDMVARVDTFREIRPPTLDVPVLTDDYAPVHRLYRIE